MMVVEPDDIQVPVAVEIAQLDGAALRLIEILTRAVQQAVSAVQPYFVALIPGRIEDDVEIAGKIALDVLDCLVTFMIGCEDDAYQSSKDVQDIRMTLVVLPDLNEERTYRVRLTMQRVVWMKSGDLYEQETINDAAVYQAFFDKLSKSVFLEKEGV